ncbi:AAA family ATPase [Bosea sp. (in: a-proteobacteria)]|uniref:AAA family ATPase n=1 Tax=Bosea sp. (in: a-proteobacteria) TaxID=1871050 RepID=UPI002B480BC5|nr:AAA family ATPase [Bosea sp. (in: a-proteobacteria)]WRH59306.1 MAG: AAA family ATPase [Bosea sp. (in: a-proteobacteria)]
MAAPLHNKENPGSAGTDAGADQKSSRASTYKNGDAGSRDAAAASPFRPASLVEIQQRLANPAAYAVKGAVPGLIPPGLTFIYGPSGAGKTFVAIGLGLHVADGRRIAGLPCNRGLVVYIASEDRYGVEERAALAAQHLGISDAPPFVVIDGTPALTNAKFAQKVAQDIRLLEQAHGVLTKLVIVDTVAASTASDSLDDDGRVSALCGQLLDLSGMLDNASVVALHHTGKRDVTSERGSKVFRDRADASFLLQKQGGRTLIDLQKMRNGRSGGRYEARLISAAHEFAPGQEIESLVMVDLIIDCAPAKPAASKPFAISEERSAQGLPADDTYAGEFLRMLRAEGGWAKEDEIWERVRKRREQVEGFSPQTFKSGKSSARKLLRRRSLVVDDGDMVRCDPWSDGVRSSDQSDHIDGKSGSDQGSDNPPSFRGGSDQSDQPAPPGGASASARTGESDAEEIERLRELQRRLKAAEADGDRETAIWAKVEIGRLTAADHRP